MEPDSTVNTCNPTIRAPTSRSARIATSTTRTVLTAFKIFLRDLLMAYSFLQYPGLG